MTKHAPVGFYTEEIRERGIRQGFKLISFDGTSDLLSHVNVKSDRNIGKYGVDIAGFEIFLESIPFFDNNSGIIIIDEIGKMECLSKYSDHLSSKILDSDKPVIATIALRGGGLIEDVKRRDDTLIFEVTTSNRDALVDQITQKIRSRL